MKCDEGLRDKVMDRDKARLVLLQLTLRLSKKNARGVEILTGPLSKDCSYSKHSLDPGKMSPGIW